MRLVNLLINTLLKLDKIKFMCYSGYIVTSLHRYIVTSLHRYIVTSLHRYIVTSLHRYIVTSLHRYIVTSLHRYIVTSLHRYIVTSLHRYIVTSLHRYIVTSLHRYIVTSLHRYIVTSLHRYIVTSLHRYIVTSLHRYIVTSLHRYIVTSLHRYIVTSLHRYIVTSLHRYIVTSLHRYIVTSLHRYIVTSLHRYIVTSLHRYIVTSLHRYIVTSLHRYIVTSLHRYIVTSLHRYIVTSLHRYIVTSLHRYIVTSLHRYIVTSLHRYHLLIFNTPPAPRFHGGSKRANALYCFHLISKKLKIQSSDNASYVRAEGEDFCGTLRLDPKNIPLPLFNFKLHLSTVSLIGNWVECASSIIKKSTLWVRTRFEHGFSLCNEALLPVNPILVLNWFSHYSKTTFHYFRVALKNYISYLFYFFHCSLFLSQLSFLSLLSFPRRRESTHVYCLKSLFLQRGKPSSKAQTCGLPQSVSLWLLLCVKSELVLSMVSLSAVKHIRFCFHILLSFLRPLSFLRLPLSSFPCTLSFLRRQESRKHLLTKNGTIKISLYSKCQVKKPSSKAQTCVLLQSVKPCWLSALYQIRTRFEHGFFTCTNKKLFKEFSICLN